MLFVRAVVLSLLSLTTCAALRIDSRQVQLDTGSSPATFTPGDFSWGFYVYDTILGDAKIRVSNGLTGRTIAHSKETVILDDGTVLDMKYHKKPNGGATIPKEDGTGYYYVSNCDLGDYPDDFDPTVPRSNYTDDLKGGVFSLEFDNEHNFVGYKQILNHTADNSSGGRTAWGTFVSCEEQRQWGRCWQVDPEGILEAEPTAVVDHYGTKKYGAWEAFAWDEEWRHGYTTDDDDPPTAPGLHEGARSWRGSLARFTPDAAALECWSKTTKAERWCTLNSGTVDYLKLVPNPFGSNEGTFEWVSDITDASPELYRGSEGVNVENGMLTFAAKENSQVFFLNLDTMAYQQYATPMPHEPDNICMFNNALWLCTDDKEYNGVWMWDLDNGAAKVLEEIDYESESAGIDFSPDGQVMYVSFKEGATWQFWRQDGLAFNAEPASVKYSSLLTQNLRG